MPSDGLCTQTECTTLCRHFVRSGVLALATTQSCRREDHMGALLTDCVLQAGLNYRYVVQPRVVRVKALYPYATRLSIFADVLDDVGSEYVLQWRCGEKPRRLERIVHALLSEGIETGLDLGRWLADGDGQDVLGAVKGVGPKTLDYMQILCGQPTCAVDRHVVTFMQSAGLQPRNYQHAHALFTQCAETLNVSAALLDAAVWQYQSATPI